MMPDPPREHHIDDPEGMEDLVPQQEPLAGGQPEQYDPNAGRPERKQWKDEEPEEG